MEKLRRYFLIGLVMLLSILLAITTTLAVVFGTQVKSQEIKIENLQQEVRELRDELYQKELDDNNDDITPTPTTSPTPTNQSLGSCNNVSDDEMIVVTNPCQNEVIGNKFKIKGSAEGLFENTLQFEILSTSGELIKSNFYTLEGESGSAFNFDYVVNWNIPANTSRVTLKFFSTSAEDGSDEHVVEFSVRVANN